MSNKKRWESAELNNQTYNDYLIRLVDIAINSYEWHNLPETVDAYFLEKALFYNGAAVFFNDDVAGFLALQTMYGGELDVYRIPNDRRAYAVNGYNKQLNISNSVLMFNNQMRTPSFTTIELYARKLYEVDRTIDVNMKAQKTPVLILSSETQRLPMKNLYMQYDGNEPYIFGTKNLDIEGIKVLNTQAPYILDKLYMYKTQLFDEALRYLGIETSGTPKKERLLTEEISTSLGYVESQRYTRLNARRQAAKKVNTMFGLNISVDFRSNTTIIDTTESGNEVTPYV